MDQAVTGQPVIDVSVRDARVDTLRLQAEQAQYRAKLQIERNNTREACIQLLNEARFVMQIADAVMKGEPWAKRIVEQRAAKRSIASFCVVIGAGGDCLIELTRRALLGA